MGIYIIQHCVLVLTGVNVSLDPTLNVMEEDAGSENICVTLMASANTGRPFIVELTTVGGTAVGEITFLYLKTLILVMCFVSTAMVSKLVQQI